MKERILCAFYHKGRKTFVPWLTFELARKLKMPPHELHTHLQSLRQQGYIATKSMDRRTAEYRSSHDLTALGKAEATAIILAEEMMRAGR